MTPLIDSTLQLGFAGVAVIALATTVLLLWRQLLAERREAVSRADAAQAKHDERLEALHDELLAASTKSIDLLLKFSEGRNQK